MEQVIRAKIPIRIKNSLNPAGEGTIILPNKIDAPDLVGINPDSPVLYFNKEVKHATAVTIKEKCTVLNIHSNRRSVSHGFYNNIFKTLDKYRLF